MVSPHRSDEKIEWDADEFRSGQSKRKPGWARTKIEAAFWVTLSVVAISACDLKTVLLYDDRVHRWALNVAYWCICINGGVLLYLNMYLKLLCGISDDWLVTAPRSIQLATALGIISAALLIYSLWPVFGMVTLPLLFVLLLGFIEVWHFVPTP